jgi:cellulose synthase/poly-beta-1,6-N-acetylglucosamine synthase-like glycosyltransferase
VYRLSIIVPFLSDNEDFEDTLVSVLQNRPDDCEVLVVHRGSYADPYELHDEVRFLEVDPRSELVAMLNCGWGAAGGEILHFLLPGVVVEPRWTQPVLDRFEDPRVAAVSPVMLQSEAPDRVVSAGLRLTHGGRRVSNGLGKRVDRCKRVFRRRIVGPGLTAAFYRRSAVSRLGGFDERCGEHWSDVDCGLSLQALGYRCVLEPESVVRGPLVPDVSSLGYREGRRAERVFWRHVAARGWGSGLILHPLVVAGTVFGAWNQFAGYSQLVGRLVSVFGIPSHLNHMARLRARAEQGEDPALDAAPHEAVDLADTRARPAEIGSHERPRRAA